MIEEWRWVVGFPDYEVSSLGRVRRVTAACGTHAGRVLKAKTTPQGYLEVRLQRDGRAHDRRVHRLVCEAFRGAPPPDKPFACHRNDTPDDNLLENLRWGSRKDNADDALENNRYLRGELCGSSRHTEKTIRLMMEDRRDTGSSIDVLALRYSISRSQISKILNGQYWKHISL